MNTDHPHLRYEFYYLLRTAFKHGNRLWHEPESLSAFQNSSLATGGIIVDRDKRMFRWDAFTNRPPHAVSIEDWPKVLKRGWKNIQFCYIEHFDIQEIDRTQSEFFCNRALIAVSLVIYDADMKALSTYEIGVPLQKENDATPDEVIFTPAPENSSERRLLKVFHISDKSAGQTPEPTCLTTFHPQFSTWHWQLKLDSSAPRLARMKETDASNPVFTIYGLAFGEVVKTDTQKAGVRAKELSEVLARILHHLLVRRWQFVRMDLASEFMRQRLQTHRSAWNKTDRELRCLSNQKLSGGLHEIVGLEADAMDVIGNLQKAVQNLEVHKNSLERKLKHLSSVNRRWRFIWQYKDHSPLIEGFQSDTRNLQNHIAYTQGDLVCIKGIRNRWRLHFDARKAALTERLTHLVTFLVIIVIGITALGMNRPQSDEGSFLSTIVRFFNDLQKVPLIADFFTLMSNPVVCWTLILIFFLSAFLKMAVRKMETWWARLRGKF